MPFGRRARLVGAALAGSYFVLVVLLCLFCWTHPTGFGYEWFYPFIATFPLSGLVGEIGLVGMVLGLVLNTALVSFIGAGVTTGIGRSQ